jgi:cysteine desulfurase/selenocysteine lyase
MTGRPTSVETAPRALDIQRIREDFPILQQTVHGRPLVYLDNAATTQKPRDVIEALRLYYETDNANVHRGVHRLSERATEAYEGARRRIQGFFNAASEREIVFVRGTTEAINLVAQTYGRQVVGQGDEILITALEHHSNIVPWQILCQEQGARLSVVPIDDAGEVHLDAYLERLSARTRLVAVAHVSNALGTIVPVKAMIDAAHARGIRVLVDGAQAAPHLAVDVRALDCDFYAFSGHKTYGPTGIGALYGKAELLDRMPPFQGGGDMIKSVSFERTTYNDLPYKFEAGTPNIAGAIGLGTALEYLTRLGLDRVAAHERELLAHATRAFEELPGVRLIGTAREKAAVLSFLVGDVHAHDVGTILDREGVAVRTGHHCAMPVMTRFGLAATTRASFAVYNTREEIDILAGAVAKVREIFG